MYNFLIICAQQKGMQQFDIKCCIAGGIFALLPGLEPGPVVKEAKHLIRTGGFRK